MKVQRQLICVFLLLFAGSFVLIPRADAAEPIATISAFDGEVSILSDYKIIKVTRTGQPLNQGDRVQVKVGFATVTFNDGAALNVNPYSSAMIQQQEEDSSVWIFKTKKMVRRITCFVGKLKFKSGDSVKDNYLQTPTAVAGLRGSEAEIGYDNANNYLNMISGELAATYGAFVQGFFDNPGVDAATKSQVFQAFEDAGNAAETGTQQAAQLAALEAIQAAAQSLVNNPDPAVAQEAQEVVNRAQQQIMDLQAGISPTDTFQAAPATTVPYTFPATTITTTTTTTTTTSTTLYTN